MRTKLNEFSLNVNCANYDIIIIVETWLFDNFSNSMLNLNNYHIYRTNRSIKGDKMGGGILISINKHFKSKIILSDNKIEHLFVSVHMHPTPYVISAVYIPPLSSTDIYAAHCKSLESIYEQYSNSKFLICGDFNLPNLNWSSSLKNVFPHSLSLSESTVLNCYNFLNLEQIINIPNSRNVFLDLAFTNIASPILDLCSDPLLTTSSHHSAFNITLKQYRYIVPSNSKIIYLYMEADYESLNNYLNSVDWNLLINEVNINKAIEIFYNNLYTGINQFVPHRRIRENNQYPYWFTYEMINLVKMKKAAHIKFKNSGLKDDYVNFSNLRQKCKVLGNQLYQMHLAKVESKIITNPKYFWKYVRDANKREVLPSLMTYNNMQAESCADIANLFSIFFSSVFNLQNPYSVNEHTALNPDPSSAETISIQTIFDAINKLELSSSSGPDEVPNIILKKCIFSITKPLHALFNKSLSSGIFPEKWKSSYVTPLYKSGERHVINNYRGISIQSSIAKLFDQLVSKIIYDLSSRHVIDNQHGFIKGRSTVSNLMEFSEYIFNKLENHKQIECIYTDLSKAFDTVDHNELLKKLILFGIDSSLVRWISSYICGRKQIVKVGQSFSSPFAVTSGVPQGSHCGPILFLIFINDIKSWINTCKFLLYADDLKLYWAVDTITDCGAIQADLDALNEWCVNNKLIINVNKCQHITFTRCRDPIKFSFNINNSQLVRVEFVKDLGVYFDSKLNFNLHVNYICSKTQRQWGFIWHIGKYFNQNCLKTLYVSLVRCHAEYVSSIWSPYTKKNMLSIDKIHNKFLRCIEYKMGIIHTKGVYSDISQKLQIHSLSKRRIITDLCFLHKILHEAIKSAPLKYKIITHSHPTIRPTRSKFIFQNTTHKTNYRGNNPLTRIMALANKYNEYSWFNLGLPYRTFKNQLLHNIEYV